MLPQVVWAELGGASAAELELADVIVFRETGDLAPGTVLDRYPGCSRVVAWSGHTWRMVARGDADDTPGAALGAPGQEVWWQLGRSG